MRHFPLRLRSRNILFWCASLAVLASLGVFLVSCGSGTGSTGGTGQITVNMSDPPSCASPNGPFTHVYVTIRSVQANTSATADDNSAGWQELAPQLNTNPQQIDLFSLAGNACLLVTLGSNNALPAGSYQQIRLLLVPNGGSSGPVPNNNQCTGAAYNCVVLSDGSIHELQLSSESNTGLKIPPGQVVGGPITVASGKDVDLNIDFNACSSIVAQGNNQYRLKPALTAGQVSTNSSGISGKIVDALTGTPVNVGSTGSVLVALEQPDATGTDVIFRETTADSSGAFNFCPLPANATFDVVAVAIDATGAAYNATIAATVPGGTNLGTIPINLETSSPNTPTALTGVVTAMGGSGSIDAQVSALQTVALPGIGNRAVAIPAEGSSISTISVNSNSVCPGNAPAGANCATYTLIEPASNPRFGVFNPQGTLYSLPAAGSVPYGVRVQASVPLSGGTPSCSPPSQTVNATATNAPLLALPGASVAVKEIDFGGCS